jgi:hypothetical protein
MTICASAGYRPSISWARATGCGSFPLASGSHSVGIVADATVHPFDQMSSYAKAMEWLRRHEPQCADTLQGRDSQVQDFLGLRDYSYSCRQVYSADRWALTGEAGAFLDPFYSPGSDYIGIGNTFIADLIKRDLCGSRASPPMHRCIDRLYFTFFDNHLSLSMRTRCRCSATARSWR